MTPIALTRGTTAATALDWTREAAVSFNYSRGAGMTALSISGIIIPEPVFNNFTDGDSDPLYEDYR